MQHFLGVSVFLFAVYFLFCFSCSATEAKDRCIAASIQFRVRDKCCFFIDGRRMTGEIGALNSKPGQHLVNGLGGGGGGVS